MKGNRLRYRQLTKQHKELICNGCGGKGGWFNPPEFLFNASCNQHDFYYWRGGCEKDRLEADVKFFDLMITDVKRAKWYNMPFYYLTVLVYFKAVRIVGSKFFQYRDAQKTKEDLFELVKNKVI
jgi:hypothetical protein